MTPISFWPRTCYIWGLSTLCDMFLDYSDYSVFVMGFESPLEVAVWKPVEKKFIILGGWKLYFFPSYCLCSSIIPFCPFDGLQIVPGRKLVIILISVAQLWGLMWVLSLILCFSNHNPDFWNMSVSREKACQLQPSFITERMLLRKVLNEGIVQMPKKKKKSAMSRD